MKIVAMLPHEKACVACGSMPAFFLFVEKKRLSYTERRVRVRRGFHKRKNEDLGCAVLYFSMFQL